MSDDATRSDNRSPRTGAASEPGGESERLRLVSGELSVTEEVSLERIGREHVETIDDKIRRQRVEVERLGPDGEPIPSHGQQPRAST